MNTQQSKGAQPGEISKLGVLDLTGVNAESELSAITRISKVGAILVRESLMKALLAIPMDKVGGVVPIPDGNVKLLSGQLKLPGAALANTDGQGDEVLVLAGQVVITSPVERVGYRQVIVSGQLIAPEGSEAVLSTGLTRVSGQVFYYPQSQGGQVKVLTGQVKMSGQALANPNGTENDALIVTGQLIITPPVEKIGYRQIVCVGQLIAPQESEGVLQSRLASSAGQVLYYPTNAPPRFFVGQDRFGRGFFEALPEPATLVLVGSFAVDADVPPDLLMNKVAAIALVGKIEASRQIVPILQVLTVEKWGAIDVAGEAEAA